MKPFAPIAIVGRACVVPGAFSPQALWHNVRAARCALSSVPPQRWGIPVAAALGPAEALDPDRTWSDQAGYVQGFDKLFDAEGFRVPAADIAQLDPLFQWLLHCGREALAPLGHEAMRGNQRCGAIIGNLSYPSLGLARFAERVWRGIPGGHPWNRFNSGLPAHLLAKALGLGAGAFALDAACASSLYAIKLACDRLHDGSADLMIAGGVNGAEDLLIHIGFCALGALSRTGQSRPFHRDADGLVPAEGAALVVLERLEDAVRAGHRIHGVIRGVGLSNDGRERTLLTPSVEGQTRAMQQAYAMSGLAPNDISLVECHATGTQVGDRIEVESMARIYAGQRQVPIGSLKSNLGHLITAAGAAGLIKVLGALEAKLRPPTLCADEPIAALAHSPFRLLHASEPWDAAQPRRAAVSAFGFGGNNAHLLVEEWTGQSFPLARRAQRPRPRVAVVALGARVAGGQDRADFARTIMNGETRISSGADGKRAGKADTVSIRLNGLRFPPLDLQHVLPQQLLMLEAAREAVGSAPELPHDRTAVFIGMGCDPEIARYVARWRVPASAVGAGDAAGAKRTAERDGFHGPLVSAGVIGAMPNIVANRINNQFDFTGMGFSVSSEELSGIVALKLAMRALEAGEIDAAVAGAVDLSCEPVHEAALMALGRQEVPGDAALALVLKRLDDAKDNGDEILAVIGENGGVALAEAGVNIENCVGHAHAASGLVRVAAAVIACRFGVPSSKAAGSPQPSVQSARRIRVEIEALGGQSDAVVLEEPDAGRAAQGNAGGQFTAAPSAPATRCLTLPAHWPAIRLHTVEKDPTAMSKPVHEPRLMPAAGAEGQGAAVEIARPRTTPYSDPDVSSAVGPTRQADALPGPKFSRQQLEVLASGRISSVFGAAFERQDGYVRQVRMPAPPLLLAERVTGIDAAPGSMGTGTIWTETDVRADAWYLHAGRMVAGAMIEAGQADLLLISWLGIDWHNRGERVYRLLGCETTWHGPLPEPGNTLVYDIHIDGHARQGGISLFFFHYDCRINGELRLSVRSGQAGFFTDEELAGSRGILWDPTTAKHQGGRLDPPAIDCAHRTFGPEQVRAFAAGQAYQCFGAGFERSAAHVRTPSIPDGRMLLFDRVACFDPHGGPWKRGYLKAVRAISPDDWFFDGHFKNDPCMPGTLMLEGCLQVMAFYLAAQGFTVERDGWRFEPATEVKYPMRCRGQVTPSHRELTYELFVDEMIGDPVPLLFADLLCSVDGLKAFHVRRLGLKLVLDWPLEQWRHQEVSDGQLTGDPVPLRELGGLRGAESESAAQVNGFRYDYASLLACAWGKPVDALGALYRPLEPVRKIPRLPGPPYHFISRITGIESEMGTMRAGGMVEAEYDIPSHAWYFEQNDAATMPLCVLMEVALQPCGWLASFMGGALASDTDLFFRNLDGTGTLLAEILPGAGTLRTRVKSFSVTRLANTIIESFAVECFLVPNDGSKRNCTGQPIFRVETTFGFFPGAAFMNQVGLPVSADERARVDVPGNILIDFTAHPASGKGQAPPLAGPMLHMIDRVDGYWPTGGKNGLGYWRARKDVNPEEWFFKAHFFQDPVQPGSLGIQAIGQLLQFTMLHAGMAQGLRDWHFEPLLLGRPLTWKYRGQVIPTNSLITTELEILARGQDERGPFAIADAWLWVDGKRIYHVKNFGMRIVDGVPPKNAAVPALVEAMPSSIPAQNTRTLPFPAPEEGRNGDSGADQPRAIRDSTRATPTFLPQQQVVERVLDLAEMPWLQHHRPTYTLPALPMMCMADQMAAVARTAFPGLQVVGLQDMQLKRWIIFDRAPVRLQTVVQPVAEGTVEVTLMSWREAATAKLSRYEPAATARVLLADRYAASPAPLATVTELRDTPNPYEAHRLFHGPAFQLLRQLLMGAQESRSVLDASMTAVPVGTLAPALLDAALHGIPHDRLCTWCNEIPDGYVGYPSRITQASFYNAPPIAGEVICRARFAGLTVDRLPAFDLELSAGGTVWATIHLVETLFPLGRIGMAAPAARKAFLERRLVPDLSLSRPVGEKTLLSDVQLREFNWLPGTATRVYALTGKADTATVEVAIKEHVARRRLCHPSSVMVGENFASAVAPDQPLTRFALRVAREGGDVVIADGAEPSLDTVSVRRFWENRSSGGPSALLDLFVALIERFVRRVVVTDPESFAQVRGQGVLFVANHQVGVESMLFHAIVSALMEAPIAVLARIEHQSSWMGQLDAFGASYPGGGKQSDMIFFDRKDRASLASILQSVRIDHGRPLLVHVEGTCALSCARPVEKISSVLIDTALAADVPIVPVRFYGGLPTEELAAEIDFPVGFGAQDYYLGRAITAEELRSLPYARRRHAVLNAINTLGPPVATETPNAGDAAFAAAVSKRCSSDGVTQECAVLLQLLATITEPCAETQALKALCETRRLAVDANERGRWLARLAAWLWRARI